MFTVINKSSSTRTYIYKDGEINTALVGNLVKAQGKGLVNFNSDHINFKGIETIDAVVISNTTPIDLTNCKYLKMECRMPVRTFSSVGKVVMRVSNKITTSGAVGAKTGITIPPNNTNHSIEIGTNTMITLVLDISELSGGHIIKIYNQYGNEINVYKVWLER